MFSSLAHRLLIARRDLHWNQDDLAQRSGVSRQYISALETNQVLNPTIQVISALAKALDVPPSYLAGWIDDPSGEQQDSSATLNRVVFQADNTEEYRLVQELLDTFADVPPQDQRMIIDLVQRLRKAKNGTNGGGS
jgi:transcriptional regulator with XRE-family HTH domain